MPITKVYMICNAYESGVGHGIENDGLENPHVPESDEFEAYDIGYHEGSETRMERKGNGFVICGGASEEKTMLMAAMGSLSIDTIALVDDVKPIEIEPFFPEVINYELPDRYDMPGRKINRKSLLPISGIKRKNSMRNCLCHCGSGKKFKRCCWPKNK